MLDLMHCKRVSYVQHASFTLLAPRLESVNRLHVHRSEFKDSPSSKVIIEGKVISSKDDSLNPSHLIVHFEPYVVSTEVFINQD
jgi:hypothetical protein